MNIHAGWQGIIASSAYQNLHTYGYHVCFRGSTKKLGIFPIFKSENRSRTACPRFLQSFALPDKVGQLQVEGISHRMVTRLFSLSNLEGNFGPDGSSPSPLPSLLLLHHHHNHEHHNNTQHTTHRDRDRDRETETKPKYDERFARQTLSMMFG